MDGVFPAIAAHIIYTSSNELFYYYLFLIYEKAKNGHVIIIEFTGC